MHGVWPQSAQPGLPHPGGPCCGSLNRASMHLLDMLHHSHQCRSPGAAACWACWVSEACQPGELAWLPDLVPHEWDFRTRPVCTGTRARLLTMERISYPFLALWQHAYPVQVLLDKCGGLLQGHPVGDSGLCDGPGASSPPTVTCGRRGGESSCPLCTSAPHVRHSVRGLESLWPPALAVPVEPAVPAQHAYCLCGASAQRKALWLAAFCS